MKRQNSGFTLVEIAIVLVIVGLLIGGVLKGQEMITNAKLKRIESDNAGIAAAMFSYQDRYLQLPGDDSDANSRFDVYSSGGTPIGTKATGDGNGVIGNGTDWNTIKAEGDWAAGAIVDETSKFFAHLRAAGLVPGSGTDVTRPTNAYGGQIGVQDGSLLIAGHVTIFGQIEGPIAKIIEARLDDGQPHEGRIQADVTTEDMNGGTTPAASSVTTYDDDKRYNIAFRL
jgi:prepilin-type N-terminal cleavage/methylation domain-containing protein